MSQATIYDQIRELKGMIYDNQRVINAHLAEIEKRIEFLENESSALKLIVEVNSRYLQSIDRLYAENHGKTAILSEESEQELQPKVYKLPELDKLMVDKFGKGINRDDFIFPLLRNGYINYSVRKSDNSKTYFPLKRGVESGWVLDDKGIVYVTQKGLSELFGYLHSKGWREVEA